MPIFYLHMTLTKETKGTYVYSPAVDAPDPQITGLYIKKHAFEADAPETIKVTVDGL